MFLRHFEANDEGILVFDETKPRERLPDIVYPKFEGKGWNAMSLQNDSLMLQMSVDFMKAIVAKDWTRVGETLR